MKKLFILLLLLISFNCYSEDYTNTVFCDQLFTFFPDYQSKIVAPDYMYWKPTREWVLSVYPKYKKFLDDNHLKYSKNFDCDDFSKFFCVISHIEYTKLNNDPDSEAVGEIYYKSDQNFYHAINFAILNDNTVMFFEPESGQEVKLSEKEIKSIYFIKL